jgi:hypothetical protein
VRAGLVLIVVGLAVTILIQPFVGLFLMLAGLVLYLD